MTESPKLNDGKDSPAESGSQNIDRDNYEQVTESPYFVHLDRDENGDWTRKFHWVVMRHKEDDSLLVEFQIKNRDGELEWFSHFPWELYRRNVAMIHQIVDDEAESVDFEVDSSIPMEEVPVND